MRKRDVLKQAPVPTTCLVCPRPHCVRGLCRPCYQRYRRLGRALPLSVRRERTRKA